MASDLPLLFGAALAFSIAMYVVSDGFDLGLGILFPFAPGEADRVTMMNSIAPFWDGNETWLVLGGTLLIGAFPLAYATLLPALYVPIMVMLFALIFRGIAFEFRFRASPPRRFLWDWSFAGGSVLAAFCQGAILGAAVEGLPETAGPLAFASPFAAVSGLGLVAGYALIGAGWAIFRTGGTTAAFARRAARPALLLTLVFFGVVGVWTPLVHAEVAQRWFTPPGLFFLWPVPAAALAIAAAIWRSIAGRREWLPFLGAILLFLDALAGLAISLYPYALPYRITLWQAAAPPATLRFLGVGVVVILPIILAYLGYAHWVFRGKATPDSGYGAEE